MQVNPARNAHEPSDRRGGLWVVLRKFPVFRLNFLLAVTTFVFALPASSEVLRVCASCSYSTLSSALEGSEAGDEIVLAPGIYREHDLLVSQALTLRGEPGAVLDGENVGTILKIQADHVEVSGLEFINVGQSYTKDFTAILVHRSQHFTLRNNHLKNVFFGIMVEKSKHGLIEGNKVQSESEEEAASGNGIHVWHSSDLKIRNNDLWGLRDGIYLEFLEGSEVTDNRSHHNLRYGLHFMFSNHNAYQDNEFYENGAGVAVMFSKFITMKRNVFRNNWGTASYGLLLKEIYDAEIEDNVFLKNTIAINTEGSTRINYSRNTFEGNGWAVRVAGACYLNVYERNNFVHNSFDVSYNGKVNDNRFENNYWGRYTGYDLDRDGTGDVPYRPVKLFSYIVNRTPETVVLLRSLFVDLINFSEKVSPIFTPDDVVDPIPAMRPF